MHWWEICLLICAVPFAILGIVILGFLIKVLLLEIFGVDTLATITESFQYTGDGLHDGDPCFKGSYLFKDLKGRSHYSSFTGQCYDIYDLVDYQKEADGIHAPGTRLHIRYLRWLPIIHNMRFPDPKKESQMINWDKTPQLEKIVNTYTPAKEKKFIWQELTEKSQNIIQVDYPPLPWQKVGEHAIGGLTDVGFAENSDLLLVVSSQGRGVFDCITGTRVARDRNDELYWYNIEKHSAMGIGPIEKVEIELAGLDGGSLLSSTFDNWSVEIENRDRYQQHLFLVTSESSSAKRFRIGVDSEVRAFGFSPTGQSLVIAISSDLTIFSREIAD